MLAYVWRACLPPSTDSLTIEPAEFDRDEVKVLVFNQQDCFVDEYLALQRGEAVSKTSRTRNLTPFLCSDGLMRLPGRLRRLPGAKFHHMKNPMIPLGHHHVVRLLLKFLYEDHHHKGVEYRRALVQQRFAVLYGRKVIGSLQSICMTYRRFQTKASKPLMADSPKKNLGSGKAPFTYTGVECFEPLYVIVHRSPVER